MSSYPKTSGREEKAMHGQTEKVGFEVEDMMAVGLFVDWH